MCLSRKIYYLLAEILHETHDLKMGANLIQTDHAMARCFGISESTARNWRRGRHSQLGQASFASVIDACARISPGHVPDLEIIWRLSRGVQEIRVVAEQLAEQLGQYVHSDNTDWHIYSGPLKLAFDPYSDSSRRFHLLNQSSMVVERALELGLDSTDILCLPELIRYSIHGWYITGLYRVREVGLTSKIAAIDNGYLGRIETALYIGDGCAIPSMISGDLTQALQYTFQALGLLNTVPKDDAGQTGITVHDAHVMIRSIQAIIASHYGYQAQKDLLDRFLRDFDTVGAEMGWIEGHRHYALGWVELVRGLDFAQAAHRFAQARPILDRWLAQFGIPFCGTSLQSLRGYALLLVQGPTEEIGALVLDGLIKTLDLGVVEHQIISRRCLSSFYSRAGDSNLSGFHHEKANALVRQYSLNTWYELVNRILWERTEANF